jgi:hypothetical protein
MSSSIEDDENNIQYNNNEWQRIRSTKRRGILKHHSPVPNDTTTTNRFNPLLNQPETSNNINMTPKISRPPPIFIHGVQNYSEMIKPIQQIAEQERYVTKSLANNIVKMNCKTPETYRKMVREFKA